MDLSTKIPLVGSGMTRSIEDHWPSQLEREQAATIEAQRLRIAELESKVAWLDSPAGDRERLERDRIRESYQKSSR